MGRSSVTHDEFTRIFQYAVAQMGSVLLAKNKEYARDQDKLHNFHRAAAYMGCSPEKAAHVFQAKHVVSLADMVDDLERGIDHPMNVWLEKTVDEINYSILLFALLAERYGWEIPPCPSNP